MIDLYSICADLKSSNSEIKRHSIDSIKKIYNFLNNPSIQTQEVITEWKKSFRYIYGDIKTNLSSNGKLELGKFFDRYNIEYNTQADVTLLFYAIQTYFSILIKCIMCIILSKGPYKRFNENDILSGNFASARGITNYSCFDFFSWPLFELDNGFSAIISDITDSVAVYRNNIEPVEFIKDNNADYVKQLYELVIPKELRHALGEYYTPEWLAEEVLNRIESFNNSIKNCTFIDPTCGSGTFLSKTIDEKRKNKCTLPEILNSVKGIDINPLAVLTAKTNFILAILDLIDDEKDIEIPIYNADIINSACLSKSSIAEESINFYQTPKAAIAREMLKEQQKVLALGEFDIVIGNPPWVNWEYLPEEYRKNSQHLWTDYKLFDAKGRDLSFSKEDISVLITYIVIDKLLKTGGLLAFVIRQGMFKSSQNGVGFRRFKLKNECNLKVVRVDDLSRLRAFDNTTTNAAALYLKKGEKNTFPVPYILWEKQNDIKNVSFSKYSKLREVKTQILAKNLVAIPAVPDDLTSMWLTTEEGQLSGISKALGTNTYKARTGVFTGGANAVYWLSINKNADKYIEITNIVERAKRKTEKISAVIEKDFVFPMLKGSNIKRWEIAYDTYILCPHTAETRMWPVTRNELKKICPKTISYLQKFKTDLDSRKGFAGWEKEIQAQEFHSVLRVGEYTFSKYKVIWKYIAKEFICAVISDVEDKYLGKKMLLPNEKIMYISFDDEAEAYYVCGVLSSTLISECVKSYMNPTSISAHVLNKLKIFDFDSANKDHMLISDICKQGHLNKYKKEYIKQIDEVINRLYK